MIKTKSKIPFIIFGIPLNEIFVNFPIINNKTMDFIFFKNYRIFMSILNILVKTIHKNKKNCKE
jgi:hypothetical protein